MENALGGTLADGLALAPRLDIAPAVFRAWKAERFAAKQRHGFGFYLASVSGCGFGVGKVAFIAVAEGDVGQFVEQCLEGLRRNRADSDPPATLCVTLSVAVQIFKRDALDFQGCKGCLLVPFGNRFRLVFRPFRLLQNKPYR